MKILVLPPPALRERLFAPEVDERLRALGELTLNPEERNYSSDELADLIPGHDAALASWGSPKFTPAVVERADKLKVISYGAGSPQGLVTPAVFERGIAVCTSQPAMAVSVAAMTVALPLARLKDGPQPVTARLRMGDATMAAREVTVVKRPPRPGFEVKADRLHGVLLKNGRPCFPVALYGNTLHTRLNVGRCADDEAYLFQFLGREIGFTALVRTSGNLSNLDRYMTLAASNGMDVITWSYPEMGTPVMDRLAARKPAALRLPDRLKACLDPDTGRVRREALRLPLEDRLLIRKALYDEVEPETIEYIRRIREYPNFLGYYNMDEPNLPIAEDRIAFAGWYWNTIQAHDPYRPALLMFARQIPGGEPWTRWGDILGYDVYPNPHVGGDIYNDPGLGTAYYAWDLRERCRRDHKVMWFVPVSCAISPRKQAIGMGRAHILCQAYSAIVYGARGLLYFTLSATAGDDGWRGLQTVCRHVKALEPALVNGDVPQAVRYEPDEFYPRERRFPAVNAAVFRYPDGGYLLLAVNVKDHAVSASFRLTGLAAAERLLADDGGAPRPLALDGGAFAERLEPYGVRAYRLALEPAPATVELAVAAQPHPEERYPLVNVPAIVRQVARGKNFVPNPCFERRANPGIPDFFQPYFCLSTDPWAGRKGSSWFLDESVLWNGHPSLRLFKRPLEEPGPKTRGLLGSFYPPASRTNLTVTFSFHARGEAPGAAAYFIMPGIQGAEKSFPLTPEWARYQLTFELPPGNGRRMGERGFIMSARDGVAVWINGLQLERGAAATEFQDDSIPPAGSGPDARPGAGGRDG